MRLALKVLASSFSLNWGYAPVAPLSKSLFYQNLPKRLQKPTSMGGFSPLTDPRNLSCRWLVLKKYLTPLAGVEKKTISGFDTRLTLIKSPWKIKKLRRGPSLGYPASAKGKSNPKPLLPFISQAPGWGVKSSRGLSYLGKSSPMIFKKSKSSTGYLGQECLPATNLLSVSKGLLLADNEGEGEAILSSEMALFISLGLFSNSTLLLERAYHDGKGENPNIVPKIVDYPFSIEELNDATKDDLFWVSGFLKEPSVIKPTSEVCFYKSSLARRLIIVG